jgi:hypothetical protein
MLPSGVEEWVFLLVGALAGYFVVCHFVKTGSAA